MNIKKISVLGLSFAFAGMFFVLPAQAQEKQVIIAKTISITPLEISFIPSSRGIVKGAVTGNFEGTDVGNILFHIKNYPDGDEIWRESIRWDEDFREAGRITIPFEFNISRIAIEEKLIFTVDLIDTKGELIASGTHGVQVPEKFAKARTASIQDLILTKDAKTNVSFLFINGMKEQKVRGELIVREHSETGDIVLEILDQAEVSLLAKKSHQFEFSFSTPEDAERYIVEVRVVDGNGKALTGYLRDSFLVEGDFAEIKSIQILPDRSVEAGETVQFVISGVANNEKGPLEMNVSANILPEKEGVVPLAETRPFTAPEDYFTETFPFVVPVATEKFNVTVKISRDGKIIEEKNNVYATHKRTVRSLLDLPNEVVSKYSGGGFEVWMVLVLTLAVIVLLVSLLHRRKKMMIWLLLVTPFLGMSVADAAWEVSWVYPSTETIYNSGSGEGFEEIVFRGWVYDGVSFEGYFQGTLNSVIVELTQGGTTLTKSVPTDDVTISGTDAYEFIVNLSDAEFSALTEGDWDVQITFDAGSNPILQTNWNGTIGIDETMPTIGFAYTPETFTDGVVEMSIACTDTKADCLQEGIFQYAPFTFSVLGNFSTGFENGVRGFEVCDKVMNCTSSAIEQLSIDFYDPVDPELTTGMTVERTGLGALTGEGGFAANQMAADNVLTLSLLGANDPTESATYTQDDDACGRDITDDTYLAEDVQVSFTVVSGSGFPGAGILRQQDGGSQKAFLFVKANGLGAYSSNGVVVESSTYQFQLQIKTGETTFEASPAIAIGETWSGTLGAGTSYETQFSNFTATVVADSQRCTPKFFVCAVNHPAGGGGPQRVEMTEFEDANQTCADKKGANWESLPTSNCGFTFTFPFILESCSGATGFPFTFPFGVQ